MSTPLAPGNRAMTTDPSVTESANEPAFVVETGTSVELAAAGWDPYEVWRTRVLAAQPPGDKKT